MVIRRRSDRFNYWVCSFSPQSTNTDSCRPFVGGTLAKPTERFPKFFSGDFWRQYPYFLPCLVAATLVFTSFLITMSLFKEVGCVFRVINNTDLSNLRPSRVCFNPQCR